MFTIVALLDTADLLELYKKLYSSNTTDEVLTFYLNAAKEQADAYLGRCWVEEDLVTPVTIPESVKMGIFKMVEFYILKKGTNISSLGSLGGSKSFFESDSAIVQAVPYLGPHRKIGIGGA